MDTLPSSSILSFLPFASSLSTMDTTAAFLTCRECPSDSAKYVSIEELECHICSDHMQFFPYECEKCRFGRFPTLYAYTMHCRDEHKMTEFYVKYKYNEETERRMAEAKTRVCLSLTTPPMMKDEKRMNLDFDGDHSEDRAGSAVVDSPSPSSSSSGPNPIDVVNDDTNENSKYPKLKMKTLSARDYRLLLGGHSGHSSTSSSTSSSSQSSKAKSMVTCQMCGISVSNQRSSLVYHANTKHIKLELYSCKICGKNWNTIAKSDVLKHVKAVHNGDENMITDNRKALCNQLRHYTQQCFPPTASKPRGRPPLGAVKREEEREKTPSDSGLEMGDDMDMEQLFDAPTEQILQFANQQYQKSVEAAESTATEA